MDITRGIRNGDVSIRIGSGRASITVYAPPGQPLEFAWLVPGSGPLERIEPDFPFPPLQLKDVEAFADLLNKAIEIARAWQNDANYHLQFPIGDDSYPPIQRAQI